MHQWHENPKTTPLKEMLLELQSQSNKPSTVESDEVQAKLLIGAMLNQASFTVRFALSVEQAVRSSLVTPKTAEALLYVLWEMVNLTMNTCDRLKTSPFIFSLSSKTSPSNAQVLEAVEDVVSILYEIVEDFGI